MTKSELRKIFKSKRMSLSSEAVEDYSLSIANRLLQLDIWMHQYFHLFLSIEEQREVNTEHIMTLLAGKDKNIVISKSDFETGTMRNYLLTDSTVIRKNTYNIPEPEDGIEIDNDLIDVVFVPLLAYDQEGNRVGYGQGFYDRFLSKCRPSAKKIGLSFFDPVESISDVHPKDIRLDYCITPKGIHTFK